MAYINIKFQTDQTGANSNVCSGSNIIFNFSLTDTYNLSQADIVIKKGSATSNSITVSIYDQQNGGGNLVASSTVLAANITQSYNSIIFSFSNTILSPGISYSLVLSSATSCVGNNPYSMKSGNFQVYNADSNTLLNTGYGISANISAISTLSASSNLSPTPTPTQTPTITPTITTSITPTITASVTPTTTPTITASVTPTKTVSATPTITPSITLSNTSNIIPTQTPTPSSTRRVNPHIGQGNVRFRLGSKIPKIYRGNSLIYNPNN